MNINSTSNTNNFGFTSRFNTEVYSTKRAVNYLKQTISGQKGFADYFDSYLKRLAEANDDVLELTQFDKYYLITNNTSKSSRPFKIHNNNLIMDLEEFILAHRK